MNTAVKAQFEGLIENGALQTGIKGEILSEMFHSTLFVFFAAGYGGTLDLW